MLQLPQWVASVCSFTQSGMTCVPQFVSPLEHWHTLFTQFVPLPHVVPQAPQFMLSLVVFTHCVPQSFIPVPEQPAMQWPPTHESPGAHGVALHPPQCCGSVCVSTHPTVSLQYVSPLPLHPQVFPTHTAPVPHAWPHVPQSSGFLVRSTHTPSHDVSVPLHTHAPPAQVWYAFALHVLPQVPQLSLSDDVSVHTPEQLVCPLGHPELPLDVEVDVLAGLEPPAPVPPPDPVLKATPQPEAPAAASAAKVPTRPIVKTARRRAAKERRGAM